jgi:hypothetical protein
MGKVRRCDDRCHNAKRVKCECWCGGHFHGEQGAAAREQFVAAWNEALREQQDREGALSGAN